MRAGVDRPAKDATVKISGAGVQEVDGQTGLAARTRVLRRRIRAAITDPSAGRRFVVRTKTTQPAVTRADLAKKYETVVVVNRGAFKLTLYKRLKTVKTYPIAVGQIGLETPAGLYAVQNKAVNPAWHVPNSAWAGDLAGKVISGSDPTNPIKARWLGHLRRGGHPRNQRRRLDRQRRLPRLHPHARLRRRGPVRARPGRGVGLHRLAGRGLVAARLAARALRRRGGRDPDLGHRHLLPASFEEEGMVALVAKDQSADEDPPLALAHHRVPHRRRVARALDLVPRPRDGAVRPGDPGLEQLLAGGDLTRGGVDAEDGHVRRG